MANDYAKMTSDLITRMSRPQDGALCLTCDAHILAVRTDADEAQCAGCGADDTVDDLELDAVTRPLLKQAGEAAHG